MLKAFLRLLETAEIMQHDDWRERRKAKNKVRVKIMLVLVAVIILLLIFLRLITH